MRLIDADALTPCLVKFASDWCIHKIVFASDIEHARTVEALPVVRCFECVSRGKSEECPMCYEDMMYDEGGYPVYFTHDNTIDEGFCQYGERRCDNE